LYFLLTKSNELQESDYDKKMTEVIKLIKSVYDNFILDDIKYVGKEKEGKNITFKYGQNNYLYFCEINSKDYITRFISVEQYGVFELSREIHKNANKDQSLLLIRHTLKNVNLTSTEKLIHYGDLIIGFIKDGYLDKTYSSKYTNLFEKLKTVYKSYFLNKKIVHNSMYILNSIFTTLFETPAFKKDVMSLFAEETDKKDK